MGTRKFGRDDHHHLRADAHLDAAAVKPFRALLCSATTKPWALKSVMSYDIEAEAIFRTPGGLQPSYTASGEK